MKKKDAAAIVFDTTNTIIEILKKENNEFKLYKVPLQLIFCFELREDDNTVSKTSSSVTGVVVVG